MKELVRKLNLCNYRKDHIYYDYECKHQLKDSEVCLMYALDDESSHTQKQICNDWNIPKTTLNTIIKQWERCGYLTLESVKGKRRELSIQLTKEGNLYVHEFLKNIYEAEELALKETLEKYPDYIAANEFYEQALSKAFKGDYHEMENE